MIEIGLVMLGYSGDSLLITTQSGWDFSFRLSPRSTPRQRITAFRYGRGGHVPEVDWTDTSTENALDKLRPDSQLAEIWTGAVEYVNRMLRDSVAEERAEYRTIRRILANNAGIHDRLLGIDPPAKMKA